METQTNTQTFDGWLHEHDMHIEHSSNFSNKVLNCCVLEQNMTWDKPLPFKTVYKNIHSWILLSDNSVIAWNENPGRGWSLIRKKLKKM